MTTYLSRLLLNPHNREVHKDLADCHDLHSRIMLGFQYDPSLDGHAREHFGVLYRVETDQRSAAIRVLVQSQEEPDWSRLQRQYPDYLLPSDTSARVPNPDCKSISEALATIADGLELIFRLRANPTKRISEQIGEDGKIWNGKRVDLRTEEGWHDWIERKGDQGGFQILTVRTHSDVGDQHRISEMYGFGTPALSEVPDLRTTRDPKVVGWKGHRGRSDRHRLTFRSVLFEGRLRVTDADKFRETLANGIGPGKAYGMGLLSIAPAPG